MTGLWDRIRKAWLRFWLGPEPERGRIGQITWTYGPADKDESPYPTQDEMNAEDAQELHRLATWLHEEHDDTRLAGEPVVDWAIRLLTNWRAQ